MKKVLHGIRSFNALGLKKHCIAVAICAGLGMTGLSAIYAASPNVNPPSLRASAPNVYVVKKGDTLWDISGKFLDKPWRLLKSGQAINTLKIRTGFIRVIAYCYVR